MDNCVIISDNQIKDLFVNNLSNDIIFTFLMIFSLITTYLGCKIVKPILFTSGALVGGGSCYFGTINIMNHFNNFDCSILYFITFFGSFLCGSLMLWAYNVANFLIGFLCGGSIGYFLYMLFLHNIHLGLFLMYDGMYWLSLIIPALTFGIIAYKKKRDIAMLLTSMSSPMLFITCLDHVAFKDNSKLQYYKQGSDNMWLYIYASMYILLSVTGLYCQYFFFQKERKEIEKMNYLPMIDDSNSK